MRSFLAPLLLLLFLAPALDAQTPRARKLLIIGIDGCRPDALLKAKTPHLAKLIDEGAFTDQAKTGDITVSGPGWTSMLTGVWREKHGVRDNKFENHDWKTYPHIFERIIKKRPGIVTASVVHWAPINEKIVKTCNHIVTRKTDAAVIVEAEKLLAKPELDVLFVHFDDVDHAGHTKGFHPDVPAYVKSIELTDTYVGRLLDVLNKRAGRADEDWLILVSTDHGGNNKGHGKNTPQERTIFLIAHGPGIAKRRLEGTPGVVDVAVTALDFMGVDLDERKSLDGQSLLK